MTCCVWQDVVATGVAGDFFEAGVWRGGACILAHAVFVTSRERNRTVWLADSFQGLPKPSPQEYPADAGDIHHTHGILAVTEAVVASNFAKYGFVVRPDNGGGRVRFVKGFFSETLPGAQVQSVGAIAVLRLDGDMYESTWVTLQHLYNRISVGGYVVADDFNLWPSRRAVMEFRELLGLVAHTLVPIDRGGVYWRRLAGPTMVGVGPSPGHHQPASGV